MILRKPQRRVSAPATEAQPARRALRLAEVRPRLQSFAAYAWPAATLASREVGADGLAQDTALTNYTADCTVPMLTGMADAAFIGYPVCAQLSQYGLMQAGVATLAEEMTRKWPRFTGASSEASAAAESLNEEMERLNVMQRFRTMAEYCGYFGGGLLYIDRGLAPEELKKPFSLSPRYIAPGSVRALVPVEPICVAATQYNSTNPLDPDYFKPSLWYVTGVGPVHSSHFLYFSSNIVPMLLRPAYNFFGVPDVQQALDYFRHFTETRESAARLLKKFSLTIVKTDVNGLLYGSDDSDVRKRIQHLAYERDNDGVYAISMEDEDVVQLNTPLAGVTDIVRQALEMLACVWRIPVVKFLGISPGGMNATGESDMRSFYDHVNNQRQSVFAHPFSQLCTVMALNLFGAEREDVSYAWPSLWEMSEKEKAELEKLRADTDAVYQDRGDISGEEIRAVLSNDPESRYHGIDPDELPEQPDNLPPDPSAGFGGFDPAGGGYGG